MAAKDSQTLPSKEGSLFRQVVKFYETKQYKKGVKAADQILKKFPEHGETLAMKGLTLNCMDRKDEAYELVRRGLKNDLRSHVCWHVYGLLYRSDRNYDEAIKSYKNALRLDKDNLQILRDLALLQVQMRDLQGFIETRHTLLQQKSANRNNWIGFAIAHHLAGNHDVAVQVLSAYEGTLDEVPANEAYEHSEMLLYKARILEEGGRHAQALAQLNLAQHNIRDKVGLMEARGRLLLATGDSTGAEHVYRELLTKLPENLGYHDGLQKALGLCPGPDGKRNDAQKAALAALYVELHKQFPRSSAVQRLPLDFLESDAFVKAADAYIRPYLRRGIPSLFRDLRPLLADPAKRDALGRLATSFVATLESSGRLPAPTGQDSAAEEMGGGAESPQTIVWARMFLAQHADHSGDTRTALNQLAAAIAHTPTLVELYSARAKVLKHAGDVAAAAADADYARSMDLADRYLNSKAVKGKFRAGDVAGAEKLAALFTRDGDQANNLFDMQAMWYEIESGKAQLARKDYGKALKKLLAVTKHFADFSEDQFDFHSYCVRKMTLRAYCDMLALEDRLYGHPYYGRAVAGAVAAYLALYDRPVATASGSSIGSAAGGEGGLNSDERRRLKQKQKKEAARKAKAEEEARVREAAEKAAREKEGSSGKGAKGKDVPAAKREKDPDPDGELLAATKDPLAEATQLVAMLKRHAGGQLQTHTLAFEVYLRKGKLLLALQALKAGRRLAGETHPDVHRMIVRFCHALEGLNEAAGEAGTTNGTAGAGSVKRYVLQRPLPVVEQVVNVQVKEVLGSSNTVQRYNEAYCNTVLSGGSLPMRAAAAEALLLLQPDRREEAMRLLMDGNVLETSVPCPTHDEAVAVHALLRDVFGDEEAAAQWSAKAAQVFRWSRYFEGPECLPLVAVDVRKEGEAMEEGAVANGLGAVLAKQTIC